MNQLTQIHLIYKLEAMRQIILNTTEVPTVLAMAQKVFNIASPVPIDPSFGYKIEGKAKVLQMLLNEITYQKSNSEIEVIQFQIASTILMLMLQFIEGSLEQVQEVLGRADKKKIV